MASHVLVLTLDGPWLGCRAARRRVRAPDRFTPDHSLNPQMKSKPAHNCPLRPTPRRISCDELLEGYSLPEGYLPLERYSVGNSNAASQRCAWLSHSSNDSQLGSVKGLLR